MEKRVPHKSSKLLNEMVAGCWGGLFQSIGIHQHLHLRKLLGQRRGPKGIKGKGGKTYLPLGYDEHYEAATEEQLDAILQPEDRSGSSGRNSSKTHIRAVIGQRSKGQQKGKKHKANPYSGRRLTRTTSIHHLECNDYVIPGEIPDDRKFHEALQNSISSAITCKELPSLPSEVVYEVIQGTRCKACGMQSSSEKHAAHCQCDALGSHLVGNQVHFRERVSESKVKLEEDQLVDSNVDRRDAALGHSKDLLETLELFHANRNLILKIIHEKYTAFPISLQDHEEVSKSTGVLTKFGSFPGQGFSERTCSALEFISRKEKSASLKENIAVSNIENLHALSTTHSTDVKPVSDDQRGYETASSSQWPPNFTDVRSKDSGAAAYRFKDIKQRIKDMIKENQNERYRISMDGILHKVPYGHKLSQEKLSRSEGDGLRRSFSSGRAVPSYVGSYSHMRSHSLSESMDRYSYLLESKISREPRRQVPERLNLVPEDSSQSSYQAINSPRTFKRMFSLPDYDPHFLSKGHASEESVYPVHSCSTSVDAIQEHPSIHINGTGGQKMQDKNESCVMLIKENSSSSMCIIANTVYAGSVKEKNESTHVDVLDLFCKVEWNNEPNIDDYADFSSFSVPMKPRQACMKELGSPDSTEDPYDTNGSSITETNVSDITDLRDPVASPQIDLDALPSPLHHAHEFHLVKNTLKKHWLDAKASHTPSSCPAEAADDSGHDPTTEAVIRLGSAYEELLSDLTDEVLLDMYADSNEHWPWLSDSASRIRCVPEGHHLLAEVWAEVGWYLRTQVHADVNMGAVINRDYNKKDRWMKLHDDVESVGLDLELQIADDLLDEVTAECLDLARRS